MRSAWLTMGRLAPKRSARSRSEGSRAPSASCSRTISRRISSATSSETRGTDTGRLPSLATL